jgi:UDP-N-acetylmuramoyl-tripeptide--D-alanyl-D-alanine ligase
MTIAMTALAASNKLGARLIGSDANFIGVSIDSRTVAKGELFIAIKGENFDGHEYVEKAFACGASAALVSHEVATTSMMPQIVVGDTILAMGRLAQFWRSQFSIPIVALTGSNGKTTVKEMLRSILLAHVGSHESETILATAGNLNNHIGVPLMMMRLNHAHRYAVFEMGMNHLGEIDYLTRLVSPDVALVIMAGTAHIGELGSREAIAEAKGEIFAGLSSRGIAVVNMHDRFGSYWRDLAGERRVIGFGIDPADEVVGELFAQSLVIRHAGESVEAHLHVVGEHNQHNALAAAATAIALNIPLQTVRDGLEDFEGVAGRLRAYSGHKDATIIDDTYNANPDSVRAAIDVLAAKPGKRYLVLGDMGELGADAPTMHADIGTYARHAELDGLFALGTLTEQTVIELGRDGWHFESPDDLLEELEKVLAPNVTVLVKGSRFMKMERVVEKLVPDFNKHNQSHGAH